MVSQLTVEGVLLPWRQGVTTGNNPQSGANAWWVVNMVETTLVANLTSFDTGQLSGPSELTGIFLTN